MPISFSDKIEWAVRGWAIGDALWLPLEIRNKEEIAMILTWDSSTYLPVKHHKLIMKDIDTIDAFDGESRGIFSDDTIFSMAGMQSISEKWKIDLQHLFDTHKSLFDKYGPYWFGSRTRDKFKKYTMWDNIATLQNDSYTNWVLMKQFPYAAYLSAWIKQAWNKDVDFDITDHILQTTDNTIASITASTHNTPIAKLTSLFHNKVLLYLLDTQPENLDMKTCLSNLLSIASHWESMVWITEETIKENPDSYMRITPILEKLLVQQDAINQGKPYSYQQIIDTYLVKLDETENPNINQTMKPWFHVASTFGLVYWCFLQDQNFNWLLNAIRIWYDTDSQWAIIGNMIWALHGPFYTQNYIDGLQHKKDIQETLNNFQQALQKDLPL